MRARARISLADTSAGGLVDPLPLPCQSLLLAVDGDESHDGDVYLGVQITNMSHAALEPGSESILVDLHLPSDLADVHLAPGATFTLCHPIRVVGHGRVVEVLPS